MKITFVLHLSDASGGSRVVATHARLLQARGHDVTVVSLPPRPPGLRDIARSIVRDHRLPPPVDLGTTHLDTAGVPHRILDRYRPIVDADLPDADVVIATWWRTAPWVAALSPAKGAKAHLVQHYEDWGGGPIEEIDAVYRLPLHKICVSRWLVDLLRTKFNSTDSTLVANSVDLDQFHAEPRGKQSVPTVGTLYSPVEFKRFEFTRRAFEIAAAAVPNLRMVAFGNGGPFDDIPVPRDTVFHRRPAQDQIRNIYASTDAWLMGSSSEGFGLPILEAMACRTPVISTPAGAAPELVTRGGGAVVDMKDPADMAHHIQNIVTLSDDQWRSRSDAAFAVATGYTWDNAADAMENALNDLARRRRGGTVFTPAAADRAPALR